MKRLGAVGKFRFALLPMMVLILALAGCAAQSGATQPSTVLATAAPVATQVAPTVVAVQETVTAVAPTVAAVATEVATAAPAATSATTTTVSGPATVMISKNDKLGDILTDDKGMTLYLFTKDTKNTSNCYDKCATNWPPLLTGGTPATGAGADSSLLGTTTRKDGKVQVTYNGWPLYYWIKDQKPGDATGQGVGGVWYVLNAKGEEVKMPGASAGTQAATSAAPAAGNKMAVSIKDFSFGQPLTVPVGTTVVWTNEDSMAHTVTATDGSFDSGSLDQGSSYSFTFTKAGTFSYVCKIHPSMKGTITVTG